VLGYFQGTAPSGHPQVIPLMAVVKQTWSPWGFNTLAFPSILAPWGLAPCTSCCRHSVPWALKIHCFAVVLDFHHDRLDHHWDCPSCTWPPTRLGSETSWENPRDFLKWCSKLVLTSLQLCRLGLPQHSCFMAPSPLCLLLQGLCLTGFISHVSPLCKAFKTHCFALAGLWHPWLPLSG
jgi:hypothetical protein